MICFVLPGSRESAYVYAITSAGVSYLITKGCADGKWDSCGCDLRVRGRVQKNNEPGWEWGGCSQNVRHGDEFSKKFMDWDPPAKDVKYLLMKHNNEAGRKVRAAYFWVTKRSVLIFCSSKVTNVQLPPLLAFSMFLSK